MSVLDANPTLKPGAYWPPGFKERAEAQARDIAERDRARAECKCHSARRATLNAVVNALASVALGMIAGMIALSLVSCTPATTRALCNTSAVVLASAEPVSAGGKLAAQVGRFVRGLFCPRGAAGAP